MSTPLSPIVIRDETDPKRVYIVHPWSVTQTFDALLLLGEILADPLSRILGRPVEREMGAVVAAFHEAQGQSLTKLQLFSLFASLRQAGGAGCLVRILQTTRYQDRPLDSIEAIDAAFPGPTALIDLMRLTWGVLKFQLGPFVDGLLPLLSSAGDMVKALMGKMPQPSAPTSTGASGAPSSPDSAA